MSGGAKTRVRTIDGDVEREGRSSSKPIGQHGRSPKVEARVEPVAVGVSRGGAAARSMRARRVLVHVAVLAIEVHTSLGRRTAVIVRRPVSVRGVVRAVHVN